MVFIACIALTKQDYLYNILSVSVQWHQERPSRQVFLLLDQHVLKLYQILRLSMALMFRHLDQELIIR